MKGGKYYSVNVPLRDGINDESYQSIFVPVMRKVMELYQPTALVLQVRLPPPLPAPPTFLASPPPLATPGRPPPPCFQ